MPCLQLSRLLLGDCEWLLIGRIHGGADIYVDTEDKNVSFSKKFPEDLHHVGTRTQQTPVLTLNQKQLRNYTTNAGTPLPMGT